MSINVTVHGNPINIRRGKMMSSDIGNTRKYEIDRRRKIRLQQVRQQSKEVAAQLRDRVAAEKQRKLLQLENKKAEELKKWKREKLTELQNEYQECLEEIGVAHIEASEEPDVHKVLQEQKRFNDKAASKRGVEAARRQRLIDTENEKRKPYICKSRSAIYTVKKKTPKKNLSNCKKTTENKKSLEHIFVYKEDSYESDNPDNGNSTSDSEIPPLSLVSSEDPSVTDNRQGRHISGATDSDRNTSRVDQEQDIRKERKNYEAFREKYNNSKKSNIQRTTDNKNSTFKNSRIIDVTNIDHLSIVNKNANVLKDTKNADAFPKNESYMQENIRPIFTDITDKIKSRNYRIKEVSDDDRISCDEGINNPDFDKGNTQGNCNDTRYTSKPRICSEQSVRTTNKNEYHTKNSTNEDFDIIQTQIDPPFNKITEKVINRIKSTKTQLENIQPELENLKRDLQIMENSSTKRSNKHDKGEVFKSGTKSTISKSVKSGKARSAISEKNSKVLFYDHNTKFEKEYKTPQNLVERSTSRDSISAHDLAKLEHENMSQTFLEESKQQETNNGVSENRGKMALQKEKLQKNYGDLLENLEQLSNKERITMTSLDCLRPNAECNNENNMKMAFEKILNQVANDEIPKNVITLPPYNKYKTKESTQDKNESSPPTLNVASWEVPVKKRHLLQNEKYNDLDESPSRDLSGQSSSSSIVIGHLPESALDSASSNVNNKRTTEIQNEIERKTLQNLLDRINHQKKLLLQEVEHKSLPENSNLNAVLKSVEESVIGNTKSKEKSSRDSKYEGKNYKNDQELVKEKLKLEKREKNLLKKELLFERKLRKNRDIKNGYNLQSKDEELNEKSSESDPVTETKTTIPNKINIGVQVSDIKDAKSVEKSTETHKVNSMKRRFVETSSDSNLNSSNGSIRDSTTSTDLSSSGVEIKIKIKDKHSNKYTSPRKFSVLTKGPSIIQKPKRKKSDVRIKQDKKQNNQDETNFNQYRKPDSIESPSTSYMSPPSEIAQMDNLIHTIKDNNEMKDVPDYIELHNVSSIRTDGSQSVQSITTREEIVNHDNSKNKEVNAFLVNYIKKLLTMSRESIDALGVSTGSEVSTPGESVINISGNIQDLRNEFLEHPDIETVNRLRKFIDENYSFVEELESTVKTDASCECPENTFEDLSSSKDNDSNKLNMLNNVQKKTVQTNLQVSPKAATSEDINHTNICYDNLTCKKKQSKPETTRPTSSTLKNHQLNLKLDASTETDKSLDISIVPHSETASDKLTRNHVHENSNKNKLKTQQKNNKVDTSMEKYTELTENCSQRIQSIADMLSKVRQEKQRLLESSDTSSTTGGQLSTEYMDLPINVTVNSDVQETTIPDNNFNNVQPKEDTIELEKHMIKDVAVDVPIALNSNEDKFVPYVPMLKDIPKQRVHGVNLAKSSLSASNNPQEIDIKSTQLSIINETSQSSEKPNPHLESDIMDLRENMSDLSSQLEGIENFIGLLQNKLNLENQYHQQRMRPPVALSRNSIMNNLEIEQGIPHELSTILEVDTPATSKMIESDLESSDESNIDTKSPTKINTVSLNEEGCSLNVEKTLNKDQKDFKFVSFDDGNIKITQSREGSLHLSRNLFSSTNNSIRITLKSPDKISNNSKSSSSNIEDQFDKSAPQFKFKPFPTYEEYTQTVTQNRKEESVDSCIRDKALRNSDENSDDTMPDVVAELLKRNVLQEPFDNASFNRINSDESSENISSMKDNQLIKQGLEAKHTSTTKKKYMLDKITKLATRAKNETSMSGVNLLSDTTDQSSSSISLPDFENALNKLGLSWAVSTLKKTQEAMALSSSSSFDSPSNNGININSLNNKVTSIKIRCDKDSSNSVSDKIKSKFDTSNNNSNRTNVNESSDSFESDNLDIKKFLMKEFNKLPNVTINSLENSQKEYIFKSLLSGSKDDIDITDHSIKQFKTKTIKRTSTPVRQISGTSSNSYAEKNNTSDGLFSGESHLSSVRNISTENQHSVDENENLSVPQVRLNIDRTLRKHKKPS